jgi:hypothetical protein
MILYEDVVLKSLVWLLLAYVLIQPNETLSDGRTVVSEPGQLDEECNKLMVINQNMVLKSFVWLFFIQYIDLAT